MESEYPYRAIHDIMGGGNSYNFSLLDTPVDISVQLQFLDASARLRTNIGEAECIARKDELFDPDLSLEKKKILMIQMAQQPNPEIYRALESYAKKPDIDLAGWANMALLECKMQLESHLLGCNRQMFICTGLGGKGNKFRFFVVLIKNEENDLKEYQQKVVRDEMSYALQRHQGELENLNFLPRYITMLVVMPMSSDITKPIRDGIFECNQFGNFLSSNFLLSNLKEMSEKEINEAISVHNPVCDDDFPPVE